MFVAYGELHLVGHQSGRVVEMLDKIVDEVLPYPLFGCQGYKAATQRVEHGGTSVALRYTDVEGWEIERHYDVRITKYELRSTQMMNYALKKG